MLAYEPTSLRLIVSRSLGIAGIIRDVNLNGDVLLFNQPDLCWDQP